MFNNTPYSDESSQKWQSELAIISRPYLTTKAALLHFHPNWGCRSAAYKVKTLIAYG